MSSRFQVVEQGPPIEVFQLMKLYSEDTFQNKVNLSVGAYRDEFGKPWVLPVVRKMEKQMAEDNTLLHEYLPVLGMENFSNASVAMLIGADHPAIAAGRAFGVQTLSGTGSLRVGAEFLNKHLKYNTFYYSTPTWENHHLVFVNSGFTSARTYRYWNPKTRGIDFDGLIEDLRAAPENSVVLLHACAHNPTGIDPTHEQWEKIADIMEERKLFPFFDSAYQGFASGDLERDAWAVRHFLRRGFELVCAQSYAKNFGLYNERVGNLAIVVKDAKYVPAIKSQLTWVVRGMYSNPPAHGARVVARVLADNQLFDEWRSHIKAMSARVIDMREALRAELVKLGTPGTWEHIVKQIGLFSYTGLNQRQVEYLVQEYHIYLLSSGRINICGLNPGNVQYVANAIHDAVTKFPAEECPC
ncbi:aspartate aminotransferase, cytoplasmic isoform X2 [Plodia interpunctella]|uniref:aspartate aminotransferase, cytoplasmic isoform X2 n=1 Tax=Plodia interpunctella TaxID=58824 RepID=UPI002368A5D0|nr:aspartate aminotransferase, cytoplasmic isoform X2 [Plodia interpunctella]